MPVPLTQGDVRSGYHRLRYTATVSANARKNRRGRVGHSGSVIAASPPCTKRDLPVSSGVAINKNGRGPRP